FFKRNLFLKSTNNKIVTSVHELFPLFLALFFKRSNEIVVYHQFEMVKEKLNIIDRYSLWFVRKNFKKIDLAIFTEKNRADIFLNTISYYNKKQVFILPNSNSDEMKLPIKLNNNKIVVTHIGGLSLNYHLNEYLQAISCLSSDRYEFRF